METRVSVILMKASGFYTEKKDGLQELTYSTRWGFANQNQKTWNVISKVNWWNLRSDVYYVDTAIPTSGEIT